MFAEARVRGTFFVLGWVAERYPAVVRRIAQAGHEIASHSYAHQLVYDLDAESFRADLRRARGDHRGPQRPRRCAASARRAFR